jgi:pimeloyl-ACP methyl ester carboxylesterase
MPPATATPDWFTKAIAAPAVSCFAEVDGARIHYLSWNAHELDKPGLLFAHGFRAHARWWSFIAPFFLSRYRVVALDFAGMGDSGMRPDYAPALFSRDLIGVIEHARLGKTTLIGHSFGGGRIARASADHPEHVERLVIIDSHIPVPDLDLHKPRRMELRPKRVYPTYAQARERFRLVPEQHCAAAYVLDHVASHSLKEVAGGWTWKFDENFSPRHNEADAQWLSVLARIRAPATFIYGDRSAVVSRAHAHAIVKHLPNARGPIAIPQAHHHVLLDQPLSLVAALKGVLY